LRCRGLKLFYISGEAQYANDIPTIPGEVYAAFTLTTVAQGYIANIDPSEILVRHSGEKKNAVRLGIFK
jgi:xanthine dehydrogenase molybdopterin-binding subunit B